MSNFPFEFKHLSLIKWQLLFFLLSLIIISILVITINSIDIQSTQTLNASQNRLNNALRSVSLINEEEQTIIEYIDRYQQIVAKEMIASSNTQQIQGSFAENENRLKIQENFAEIRDKLDLFEIRLNIAKTSVNLPLQYPNDGTDSGANIDLVINPIEFTLPLLHEQDMFRLLNELENSPGLYQIKECGIELNSKTNTDFYNLAQHFTGRCQLFLYAFNLDPEGESQ